MNKTYSLCIPAILLTFGFDCILLATPIITPNPNLTIFKVDEAVSLTASEDGSPPQPSSQCTCGWALTSTEYTWSGDVTPKTGQTVTLKTKKAGDVSATVTITYTWTCTAPPAAQSASTTSAQQQAASDGTTTTTTTSGPTTFQGTVVDHTFEIFWQPSPNRKSGKLQFTGDYEPKNASVTVNVSVTSVTTSPPGLDIEVGSFSLKQGPANGKWKGEIGVKDLDGLHTVEGTIIKLAVDVDVDGSIFARVPQFTLPDTAGRVYSDKPPAP